MCPERSDLMESLRRQNRDFRRLEEKHREYETSLNKLSKSAYLTPKQELLKQEIKKKKLWTKDRMAEIVRGFLEDFTSNACEPSPKSHLT